MARTKARVGGIQVRTIKSGFGPLWMAYAYSNSGLFNGVAPDLVGYYGVCLGLNEERAVRRMERRIKADAARQARTGERAFAL